MSKTPPRVQGKRNGFALARSYVMHNAPYFSPTLYAFIPTPYEGLTEAAGGPLAVTERLVLLYEPAWVASISSKMLATGLCHEVMHDQLRHIKRGMAYPDRRRFNLAGDLFINGLMTKQTRSVKTDKSGRINEPLWEFPEWAAMPAKYGFPDGLTADEYYKLLEKKGSTSPEFKGFMCGTCGGVAGNPSGKELEKKQNEAKGRSELECRSIARSTSQAIKAHMQKEGRGSTAGNWSEFFDIGEETYTVPWPQELANIIRFSLNNVRTGGIDYSMRRPSIRSYLRGWPLPGLIGYDPEVAVIVDDSGSMGKEQIGAALRVTSDVMTQTGIRSVWFMEADTQSQRTPTRMTARDLYSIELKGRGGTNFCIPIEYMQQFKPRVSLVIYLTDGDGPVPAEAPTEFEMIWGIVPSPWSRRPAEWGRCIMLGDYIAGAPEHLSEEEEDEY